MKLRNLILAGTIVGTAMAGISAYGNSPEVRARIAAREAKTELVAKQKAEADAKQKTANEKYTHERAAYEAKQKAEREAAEAKFKAEGWWEAQPGIYVRWCTETCNNSKVIGDNRYSLMEVWAKDANAGDIYAQVNLVEDGVVVGWTNDTIYLSQGQRGVLTFDSYQYFDQAQLVKFNAHG